MNPTAVVAVCAFTNPVTDGGTVGADDPYTTEAFAGTARSTALFTVNVPAWKERE